MIRARVAALVLCASAAAGALGCREPQPVRPEIHYCSFDAWCQPGTYCGRPAEGGRPRCMPGDGPSTPAQGLQ